MAMKDTPSDERPREKLLRHGAQVLNDKELLALLLRTGTPGRDVLTVAAEVLERFGGFAGLLHSTPKALQAVKGLGPAKRAEIAAVVEMCKRALAQGLSEAPVVDSPQRLRELLALRLAGRSDEVFAVVFLSQHYRLLAVEELFHGTLNQTAVYPRVVVKRALAHNAAAVVLAHNHPSGVAEPSSADRTLTHTLRQALMLVDVKVLDHVIVCQGSVVSMAERGLMG